MHLRRSGAILLSAFLLGSALFGAAGGWEQSVGPAQRGPFPNPRPLHATYSFGWNNMVAATADIDVGKSDSRLQIEGTGQTIGLVRRLWNFEVHHRAVADPATLRPVLTNQVEEVRGKTITTNLIFDGKGVVRTRSDSKSQEPPKPKSFTFPGVLDLHSALLYLRSQPLTDRDVYRVVVYPATAAYLATVTVAGRENLSVAAGEYKAIKLDLQLNKIGKNRELEPHKKFRRASVWISEDADRLLLRIEASVFVGTVFAELQSVRFKDEKS